LQPRCSLIHAQIMSNIKSIRQIGLTGGIGSGKSTVGQILAQERGFALIDADEISRTLTAPGGAAIQAIKAHFGDHFIDQNNALNRPKMRELVFHDLDAKQMLEAILHPKISEGIDQELSKARSLGFDTAVLDIPLLAESAKSWLPRLTGVLVIDCSPQTQVMRVMQRSGLSQESALSIIASQASRESRRAIANWIILNDALTIEQLRQEVLSLNFKI